MTRCYVCNAEPSEPCHAVDGQGAECPRPSVRARPDPRPVKKCPSGRPEHQMELVWTGQSTYYLKCRWCSHKEEV